MLKEERDMRETSEGLTRPDTDEAVSRTDDGPSGVSRRAFLATGIAVGAGATLGPLGRAATALGEGNANGSLTEGDAAILRFLSAAEIIETDLWRQYNELGGVQDSEVPGGTGSKPYQAALEKLDEDMPQYIHDNTGDEFTHFNFINAYLKSRGSQPVDLSKFRVLPSSEATGAQKMKRLTNLMELTVDTSYWTRYRNSTKNPDFGDSFPPAVPGLLKGRFPAIPRNDKDLAPEKHIQAIANTAGFHFGFIEQGGTSLYMQLAQRVSDPEVLRVVLSIGPTEAMHFQTWHDKAGNAPVLTDPNNGLEFPDLGKAGEELKKNLIMPEPTAFLRKGLPTCSIVRPTQTEGAAMGAVKALGEDGLFRGQGDEFFDFIEELASAADAAVREV
jgi:hypothetical protein